MKIVWDLGQAKVRDVYEVMRKERKIAYTTVMTLMRIMEEKGHLKHHTEGRAYVYKAARPKAQVMSSMVREFLGRVFDGSAEPLMVHLLRSGKLSKQDIDRVIEMLEEEQGK